MDTNKPKTQAKDFFLYFGAIALLYTLFGSELSLIFNYINHSFPDVLNVNYYSYDPYASSIRFSLAVLIILFPVFLAATWFINKELRSDSSKKDIWVRKWLLYLTLFIAIAIVVVDLVVLVNTFLNGEITTRFVLKVLSTFVLTGFTLTYYLWDLKEKYIENKKLGKIMGGIATVIVIASIILGFTVIGSPSSQRMTRLDQQKVNDLQNIQWQIVSFWQAKQKLPQTLVELNNPISGQIVPVDTETNTPYEYKVTGKMTFEICATFNKESSGAGNGSSYLTDIMPMKGGMGEENWKHGVGKTCFERTIDKDLYPPFQKASE